MIAGLQLAHQRRSYRRHPARRGARRFGPFEETHAFLEHGDRRIGIARIDEAGLLPFEPRLGDLCALIDIALGEEERFRGLAVLRAQAAAVHEPRRFVPSFRIAA